ncbi:MAG: hypothetical protein GXX82_11680 [Syntrophorhabdus sp.]|nr:hypothetical protein [Syntrophorhabdus sp.]
MIKQGLANVRKVMNIARAVLGADRLDEREKAFIRHNEKVWEGYPAERDGGEILLELTRMSTSIIAFSYLANLLAMLHHTRIVAYSAGRRNMITEWSNRKVNRIYRSFNVSECLYHELRPSQRREMEHLFAEALSSLRSKRDVEDLRLERVWIGDLLYDSHCMRYKVPTVLLEDPRFHESLKSAIGFYVFWRDYLDTHDVRCVIVTHTVYVASGIVTRLAVQRKIPVYHANATHLHYLTEKDLWAYDEFFYYPEQFRELPEEMREEGLHLAKERLEKRFSGEVGVDMHYSTKSAYGKVGRNRVLNEGTKTKILVATHCFFDSPHPFGVNLFPDFYEWLYFLGDISEITDYEWYIKTHPDFLPGNIPIIEEFISKYPRFRMIPSDTSHLQLVEEGINFGLTVYGTIGFEYAALGIPVINASLCNPRIRYSFNKHPRSIEEYRDMLMNLPAQKLDIDLNEVYEYYYMAFLHNVKDWLFEDYDSFIQEIGGYYQQYGSVSYARFMEKFSLSRHGQILASLRRFVESGQYNFQRKFMEGFR